MTLFLLRALWALYPSKLFHLLGQADRVHLDYQRRFAQAYPLAPDEWGVVFPYGMGDLYVTCAFARQVRERRGGSGFVVFVDPRHAYIPSLFEGVTRIVPVEGFELKRLHQYHRFEQGRLFTAFPLHRFARVIGWRGVSFLDYYRLCLGLALDTRPEPPRPQTAAELEVGRRILAQHGLRESRTVILAPRSPSTPEVPAPFWAALAADLRACGYDVATNAAAADDAIPGTVALQAPLSGVIAVAQLAGRMISARSGLCDLLAHAPGRLTVVYPDEAVNPHARLTRGFGMTASGWRPDTVEVWFDGRAPERARIQALAGY